MRVLVLFYFALSCSIAFANLSFSDDGPLQIGGKQTVKMSPDLCPFFRVEAYATPKPMQLSFEITAKEMRDDFQVLVEGPLEKNGDDLSNVLESTEEVRLSYDPFQNSYTGIHTFKKSGVYRVLPTTQNKDQKIEFEIQTRCRSKSCFRPEISVVDFLREIRKEKKSKALLQALEAKLSERLSKPGVAKIHSKLEAILSGLESGARFPTFGPVTKLKWARPLLMEWTPGKAARANVNPNALETLFGECRNLTRPVPSAIVKGLPEVKYGHFADYSLSKCQAAHSIRLAHLLDDLATRRATINYKNEVLSSPDELIEALAKNGHTIEVRNERTYANFLSLTYKGMNVRWPVWLRTGLELERKTLDIPMGHSQHAWYISGPLVNARVAFFLSSGDGIGFFPLDTKRPHWTGYQAVQTVSSNSFGNFGLQFACDTIEVASEFMRLVQQENKQNPVGPLADGYGLSGICNDSNAVIELATQGSAFSYPLVRLSSLDSDLRVSEVLEKALSQLPRDAERKPEELAEKRTRADTLRRILLMSPHQSAEGLPDKLLATQIEQIRKEVLPSQIPENSSVHRR